MSEFITKITKNVLENMLKVYGFDKKFDQNEIFSDFKV